MWTFQEHQVEGAEWALATIRKHGLAYLSWQERTRKTGTALLTVENSKANTCLVITKKRAIDGWNEHLANHKLIKKYTIINYESAHKVEGDFDFIILDEAHHAISSFPKPTKTWRTIAKLCHKKPILYLSATPYAEHLGLIFHQLKLSAWTPFKFKNGYDFFRAYGVSHMIRTPYALVESYSKFKDEEILKAMSHLFNFKTRQDVGIEHEPEVNLIEVELNPKTKAIMKEWKKHKIIELQGTEIIGDSSGKLYSVHYQLEGGTVKAEDKTLFLEYAEKCDYIAMHYDESKIAIMAHFVAERQLLSRRFPNTPIYSSDGHAEGVDLSHIDKLIVYSMSFKTSKHTQRLARQANHDRDRPIIVDILVCAKPAIGKDVYNAVALKKENFVRNSYEQ